MIDGYLYRLYAEGALSRRSFLQGVTAVSGVAAAAAFSTTGLLSAAAHAAAPQGSAAGAAAQGLRFSDANWVTSGWNSPVRADVAIRDLEIIQGAVPADFNGTLYRCGPEPQYPSMSGEDMVFNGEGMVHAFYFENGHVDYRCRYVRTERFLAQEKARRSLFGVYRNRYTNDPLAANVNPGTSNTHVMWHAGKLFALKEDDLPYELDPHTLETVQRYDFGGKIRAKWLTAHPKIDMATNEMFTYAFEANGDGSKDVAYYVIDEHGKVAHEVWFKAPYACNVHDWAITEDYVIFPFAPLNTEIDVIKAGGPFYRWHHDQPLYFAVLPRRGSAKDVRYFKGPPSFVAHIMNAYNDGKLVHIDADLSKAAWPFFPSYDGKQLPPDDYNAYLTRITLDMGRKGDSYTTRVITRSVASTVSRCDDRYVGRAYRNGYTLAMPTVEASDYTGPPKESGIARVDPETGKLDVFNPGNETGVQEPVFAERRPNAPEGDGYVMVLLNRIAENRSDLVLLDGRNLKAGPIATIKVPVRARTTFHGFWIPQKTLQTGLYTFDPRASKQTA